ncbi:proheparin-binding EGF-like growth factor isoform X1 [Pelobates fuscus]|uniref:proheparin-binding EGF-like growth factor isoform X1 n=1 Tax=Pelobates fuscus TaxID=191477 RepID=UPI002FE434B9
MIMNMVKLFILTFIEVSYIFVHGAVIEANQNIFNKGTRDFAVVGESLLYNEKEVFSTGNHILAFPRMRTSQSILGGIYTTYADYTERVICSGKCLSSSKSPIMTRRNKGQNKKKKGKGRKIDPCQRKYKEFCIHGECRYLKALKTPSCVCQSGYHGERCHALTLPLEKPSHSYDHTTVLAIVAVILSSFCLVTISCLLALRYHKRGAYNVENEEKFKLGVGV